MSDTENRGPGTSDPSDEAAPDSEPTTAFPVADADTGYTEPTTPYPAQPYPVPPAAAYPQFPPTHSAPPYYPPAPQPYPVFGHVPVTPAREPAPERSRVPGWTWLLVSGLALVLGIVGGFIGAELADDDLSTSGAGLTVPRRTAAPLPADNESVASVAAKVLPSTVQIIAEYEGEAQGATGSGFVVDDQGHVITNNHVVAEAASDNGPIEVIDQEGRHLPATVVGRSAVYDIAVLKVKGAESITPLALGSADQMRVGETVVAVGSPLGLSATVTSGIISAVNRPVTTGDGSDSSYINAVQTDAAINPGNSGGPLVNLQGEVIGVNSAIASLGSSGGSEEGGNIGVGFAIPVEQVRITTDQILRTGKALYPVIGANVKGTAKLDGATVESIGAGSPASKSDLKVGDVITKVDGQPVTGSSDVVVAVRSHQPGEKVKLTVERGGKTLIIEVGLDAKVG